MKVWEKGFVVFVFLNQCGSSILELHLAQYGHPVSEWVNDIKL